MTTSETPFPDVVAALVSSSVCQGCQQFRGLGLPQKAMPDAQTSAVGRLPRVAPHAPLQTLGE